MPDGSPKTGDPRVGVRHTSAMGSIIAAATTVTLHQLTPNRTAIIRKIMWANRGAVSGVLRIGSGDFTARIPEIDIFAGLGGVLTEDDLPNYEFRLLVDVAADITTQSDVGGAAPADIQVMIEVEEFGEQ